MKRSEYRSKHRMDLREKVGVKEKRDYKKPETNEELNEKVNAFAKDKIYQISKAGSSKHERSEAFDAVEKRTDRKSGC